MSVRRRGQPVVLLVALLAAWVGVRAAVWQAPFERVVSDLAVAAAFAARSPERWPVARAATGASGDPARDWGARGLSARELLVAATAPFSVRIAAGSGPNLPPVSRSLSARLASSHQLLFLTGLGYTALGEQSGGSQTASLRPARAVPLFMGRSAPKEGGRWSADAWVLVRGGPSGLGASGGTAGYGGSQAGAVLRYHLAPGSPLRPALYVRLTGSFGASGGHDREAAAGLALRPFPGLPVAALAEGRVIRSGGHNHLRPALALVSELPPLRLPLGAEAELYGQAGYVGGKDGTAFADGQATLDRPLLAVSDKTELRLGGGVWGGAQRGAARLDVGPRASLRMEIAGRSVRATADWRFRVLGNASPGSGPALTLSAGF